MTTIEDLRPTKNARIYDLVREAGHDVSDWSNYANGDKRPASNPRYCYEWVFEQTNRPSVLTLWIDDLKERDGDIVWTQRLKDPTHAKATSGQKTTWHSRARRVEFAIRRAAQENIPIRVIVVDGDKRSPSDRESKASRVKRRLLDSAEWSVLSYDQTSGLTTLKRGIGGGGFSDQFTEDFQGSDVVERVDKTGKAFVRNPEVRRIALERAGGRCEHCGQVGFRMNNGTVFLETHHIVPLSEGGPDTTDNVAAICPNHHREAHYGAKRDSIRKVLRELRDR